MSYNLYLVLISFGFSFILSPIIVKVCDKFNHYDEANNRKIHKKNVGRLGGLAIFTGFLVPFLFVKAELDLNFNIDVYLIALVFAFLIGFVDDIIKIRARYKLILQICCGLLVVKSGLSIQGVNTNGLLDVDFRLFPALGTVLWTIMFMNAVNLLDGMDGLASGILFIANLFILLISLFFGNSLVFCLTLLIAGSILGFFIFNFPPAKIFMGDGGAYFLGFMYATIPLMGFQKMTTVVVFLIPLTLLLIPLVDILIVISRRIKLGYNIFVADKNHIHHRLMHLGFSHKGILFILYTITAVLGSFSLIMIFIPETYSYLLFCAILSLFSLPLFMLNKIESRIISKIDEKKNKHPVKNAIRKK